MTREGVTFLTKKDFDVKSLIKILKEQSQSIKKNEDEKILNEIISLLEKNDLTMLSPQEVHFLESNEQETWGEYLVFRYKMNFFPKQKIVYDFPIYLLIEPVSACNLRCIMCFQIDETFTSDNTFMGMIDFELFKKIIDEAVEGGTRAITLASRGEPTLHPKLGEMLEYCSGKFFELKINTNATKLNEKLIHQILKSGVTNMVFSIDSYEKNEYESIRVKGIFEEVVRNVKKFKEIREKFYPDSKCETRVSGVKVEKNQDPKKFRDFWKDHVDNVVMVEMENTICIIENLNDIKIIKKQLETNPNLKIFTLNYNTHKQLEKNNINHEIGEYHLTTDDKSIINQMATDTTLNWWKNKEIQNILTIDNIIIPEFIEMELFQYILAIFKSAKTILRIIDDISPNEILSVTNLNPFVQSICNEMNIKFLSLSDGEMLSLHYDRINIKYNIGPVPLSITTSRKNYKIIKNFTEKLSQKSFRLSPEKKYSENDTILLLEFNPMTYESLIQELNNAGKNIFLLNQRRPAILNKKSLEILKKSNCKIIDLSNFEKKIKSQISSEIKLLTKNLEKLWEKNSLFENLFSVDSYTLWNSIKPIFSKMCNQRFTESLRRILLLNELFMQFNISQILEWAETGQEEKEVLAVSKKYGIKSIMLQHSMFPIGEIWKPFGRFLALFSHEHQSDYQAIWGNLTHDYAISNNHSKEKLLITGSPKHDSFFSIERNQSNTGKILLATTGPPAIFTEDSTTDIFLKYDKYIKEIFRVIKKNYPQKELIVKPHPQSDFINNALDLINETDSNAKIILEANLPELINECDLVISFNTSSILLESIILEKPTISLITDDWAKENEIIKMNGVMSINDVENVEASISKIISNEDYKIELQSNAKQFLENYLSNHGTASKQLVEILKNI